MPILEPAQRVDPAGAPLEAGGLGARRLKRRPKGNNRWMGKELAGPVDESRLSNNLETSQASDELLRQLTRVARAYAADQAQRAANKTLRLADAVALLVGDQRLNIRSCH